MQATLRETVDTETIDTGIGKIDYQIETGNLLLIELMENFEAAIKKHTARRVSELLASKL
jgi:hypothetical protein